MKHLPQWGKDATMKKTRMHRTKGGAAVNNIFHTIQALWPEYTKSDKKVATFILDQQQNITNMTLADIAEEAGVSEGSVVRFLNKLGIKKLIDLKLSIAKSAEEKHPAEGALSAVVEEEFTDVVHNTASLMDPGRLSRAVDLIEAGRQVYFFGVAVSGIAASTGENSFIRMGKPVHAIQEGHMQMIAAAGMTEEDVVVVFSLTGNTRDTCEAAALASQQGAKIISVTSYVNSQLARISDVVLQTFAKEEIINGGRITGLVSQLYVLDCLKREYNKRNRDRTVRLKEEISKAILSKKV